MNLIDLCGPGALEREFYDKIIQNIESTFPGRFEFIVSGDAPGEPFKEIPHTHTHQR